MPILGRDTWVRRRRNWIGLARNVGWWARNSRHPRLIAKLLTALAGIIALAVVGTGAWAALIAVLFLAIAGEAVAEWRRER